MSPDNHYARVWERFRKAIPADSCKQYHLNMLTRELVPEKLPVIMDLGCGSGESANFLSTLCERYIGIDISDSPESRSRNRNDFEFYHFDGVHIPLPDESVDAIYMKQVLEHVLEPWRLLKEIHRVLKTGGLLLGSVSQLEPYHSYSILNYTAYGICGLLDLFNLELFCLRPGIDGITLVNRTLNKLIINRGSALEDCFWFASSPLKYTLEQFLKNRKSSIQDINYYKLVMCGQFCFAAKKVEAIIAAKK